LPFESFNFRAFSDYNNSRIADRESLSIFGQIIAAFPEAERIRAKPTVIIARTVKGKGVSFMENKFDWHYRWPDKEQLSKALAELGVSQ
jgi:transketolase